ncbi:hypothetical protein ACSBL2_14370 [Pedobacter sp. AW31-3R]|uniref:hypothetical protein n=1 Tax=Pedobacter sp. AW31-3R TaxID=3445781 RepID=UPI003FA17561
MEQNNYSTLPPFRKLRGYAFDPALSLKMDTFRINDIVYKVDWESVDPGPVGEYLEVIDYDPTLDIFYTPVDLEDPYILAQDGLDPSESNPLFHQQMVYAVAMVTIRNFEQALGRKILWASRLLNKDVMGRYEDYVQHLRIYPHALRDANAYYSPVKKALLFGYFSAMPADETLQMPNSLVFTCLSHDIIAHEVTHAILDGMHRNYNDSTNPDVLAFHEAFADIVALFQHFTFPDVLKHQIAQTRGDLKSQNLLGKLAQQFGASVGKYGSLRDAIGSYDEEKDLWEPKKPNPEDYRTQMKPHERGSILVAAIFEAFISIYQNRVADLLRIASNGTGILPLGELHPDLVNRLAIEAAKAAKHVLNMCIRALDYCPPVDINFGDFLRAIVTADLELVAEDNKDYRLAFIDAFRKRGIYPTGIKTLSVESLQQPMINLEFKENSKKLQVNTETFNQPEKGNNNETIKLFEIIATFLREYANKIKYVNDREEIFNLTRDYIAGKYTNGKVEILGLFRRLNLKFDSSLLFSKITGLAFLYDADIIGVKMSAKQNYRGPSFQIQNLRLVSRVGPNGNQVNQVVFSVVQTSRVKLENGKFIFYKGPQDELEEFLEFKGGCTLIFDLDTLKLKYAISKPLIDVNTIMKTSTPQINEERLRAQLEYTKRVAELQDDAYALNFSTAAFNMTEPFCFLHQH